MRNLRSRCALALLFLGAYSKMHAADKRDFKLVGLDAGFWQIIDHDATMTPVATGFGFTEGPAWDKNGFLYVSDEVQNKIFKVFPNGEKRDLIALGNPDGNTFDRKGNLIDCASDLRAILRITPDGRYTVLADHYHGLKLNTPNDIVTGPDGALYFTDPTMDLRKGEKQEQPVKGVYRLDERGDLKLLVGDMKQPNGLAFSPDGKRLYVDDSEDRTIRVFRFHKRKGDVSDGTLFATEAGEGGVPDGMRIDKSGNIFVTGPLGIWIWSPAGKHLGTIIVPEQPANLAWGDADEKSLYITATTSVYKLQTRVHGFVPAASR
jgi:gluconolactonase